METKIQNSGKFPFPQETFWKETLDVIGKVDNIETLTNAKLIENLLPFNSQGSRARCSHTIVTRFKRLDPDVLHGFFEFVRIGAPPDIIEQIWRILFCEVEAIFAQMYLDVIWPIRAGQAISRDDLKSYMQTTFPQQGAKLQERLIFCLRHAGYILPHGRHDLVVVGLANLEDALVIATHLLVAKGPRTIKISEIEANPYWKFLGYKKFDHVRVAFRNAEAKGTIMRYAVVDHLEQITTRYTWPELLAKLKGQP